MMLRSIAQYHSILHGMILWWIEGCIFIDTQFVYDCDKLSNGKTHYFDHRMRIKLSKTVYSVDLEWSDITATMYISLVRCKCKRKSLPIYLISPWTKWPPFWQTTFLNAFSSNKIIKFRFQFHGNLFAGIQLTINQHCRMFGAKPLPESLLLIVPCAFFLGLKMLCATLCCNGQWRYSVFKHYILHYVITAALPYQWVVINSNPMALYSPLVVGTVSEHVFCLRPSNFSV